MFRPFLYTIVFAATFVVGGLSQQARGERLSDCPNCGVVDCPDCGNVGCAKCKHGKGGLGLGHKGKCPNCIERDYAHPSLFYNFYVPPTCGGTAAQLYLCPQPVPENVGRTYYTYQPFMPHEMLYPHKRTYHRYYDGGRGLSRASVHWIDPQLDRGLDFVKHVLKRPR